MNKREFLDELKIHLEEAGVASSQGLIDFYDEAISDRMDAGMSEEEAVTKVESIDEIVKRAKLDMPMPVVVKNKIKESHKSAKKSGRGGIWIILSIIGFPVWFPLLVAAAAVLFSVYIVLWSLVISFFAVEFAFAISAVACFLLSFTSITGFIPLASFIALLGSALLLAGIALLLWKPLLISAKGMIYIVKAFVKSIKKLFI